MKVSLLIPCYNMKGHIRALLDSVARLETGAHELEVILRDNASSDGSPDVVAEHYPWVNLIRGEENLGFVGNNNIMFEHSTGDVICGVNLDTILAPRFLLEGIKALKEHPGAVAVNTNMLMPWVVTFEEFSSAPPENLPAYEYQLTPDGFIRYVPVEPVLRETNFITGGGFFLLRSALKAGEKLFDPAIYMYCEDTELSLRLQKRGTILYAPGAVLFHNHPPVKARSFNALKKLFMITWNRFYVMAKHDGPASFAAKYPRYLWGLVRKMSYLGLPASKRLLAYGAGAALAVPFALLFPYWLWRSVALNLRNSD